MRTFQGSMVALVTPFKNGKIDEPSFRNLIEWQIESGTNVLVPCGTTGEAPTLTTKEMQQLLEAAVDQAKGRVPVLAGAGANATDKAIELTRLAEQAKVAGLLHVTPYYNKPTQEGLYRHFAKIAASTDLPIVLYNVPVRTAVNLEAATALRLAKIENIVGIKEASGNLEQIRSIIDESHGEFAVYSGDDALNEKIYELGGRGTISVTANVAPDQVAKVWNEFADGHKETARKLHEALQTLNKILFVETNPIPVKTALAMMGKCREEFRLPLCEMNTANREQLKEVLKKEKLLS